MTATVPAVTAESARELTDKIKLAVEGTWHLICEAYQSRAWSVLGYSSWDDYCTREFGTSRLRLPREDRTETVQSLRDAGLSLRAIASATGDSHETARKALAPVKELTPEPVVYEPSGMDEFVDHTTGEVIDAWPPDEPLDETGCEALDPAPQPKITGIDGKRYTPPAPRAPQRKPLTDEFRSASLDLDRIVGRVTKLADDDRFKKNADQISQSYLHDLIRARDALQRVIDQLPH